MDEIIHWIWRRTDEGERLPTKEDADEHNCVLVMHAYQGVMVTGWFNVERNRFVYAWARCPKGPEGADIAGARNPDLGLSGRGLEVHEKPYR